MDGCNEAWLVGQGLAILFLKSLLRYESCVGSSINEIELMGGAVVPSQI
jgi:hypothetical protein